MAVVSSIEQPQSDELRELYDRLERASGGLGILNIFKVMAHNPKLLRDWLRMATTMLTNENSLSPRLRELAILRVFQNTGGEYGFAHHIRIGKQVGLTDNEIASLKRYDLSDLFSVLDRQVLRYTDAVTALARDGSVQARSLGASLSDREIVELTFCIGHWNMLARILQPLEVAVDASLTRELPANWREWL